MFAGVDADCTVSLFWERPASRSDPTSTRATRATSRFVRLAPSYPSCRVVSSSNSPVHRTRPTTTASPRRITQEGPGTIRNTLRLSTSALFGSCLATRFYDASSLFSVSGLRPFRCCDFVFISICATISTPCPARPLLYASS